MISLSLYNLALFIFHPFLAYLNIQLLTRYLAEITKEEKKKMAKKRKTKYERRYRKIFLCSSIIQSIQFQRRRNMKPLNMLLTESQRNHSRSLFPLAIPSSLSSIFFPFSKNCQKIPTSSPKATERKSPQIALAVTRMSCQVAECLAQVSVTSPVSTPFTAHNLDGNHQQQPELFNNNSVCYTTKSFTYTLTQGK